MHPPFSPLLYLQHVIVFANALLPAMGTHSAPDRSELVLEEVIVSAEKRSQNLQDVPVSVTVISGDRIGEAGIVNIADIALQTPNLNLNTFNIGEPQIFLRGIGNTSDSAGADPAVAVFIDEVYIGRAGGSSFDLYDLDHIEVLRGPQGTLYGKNVAGGAINLYTQKPSDEFEAKMGLTTGNYDLLALQGYINGPLANGVAGKFTFSKRNRDGYSKSIRSGQDLDDENSTSARGQVLLSPSGDVEWLLGFDYSKDDNNGQCRKLTRLDDDGQPLRGVFVAAEAAAIASSDPRECEQSLRHSADKEIFGLTGRVAVDFSGSTFTSITAYRESDFSWLQSLTGGDMPPRVYLVEDGANEKAEQFSQEFRLSSVGDGNLIWVTGLYLYREEVDRSENFVAEFSPLTTFTALGGDVSFFQNNTTNSYAVFGQMTWEPNHQLGMTLGARYTYDEKEIDQSAIDNVQDATPPSIPLFPGAAYSVSAKESWEQFSPRLSLDWHLTDEHLIYFTASQGYKSGAFPSQANFASVATTALDPEIAVSLELGAKTQWFNNRLRVNAAVFDLDYKDLQVFQLIDLILVSANANKASVRGIELDFSTLLTNNLSFTGSYAAMDTEYDDYTLVEPFNNSVVDNSGNDLARASDDTWTLALNYRLPLNNAGDLEFNVNVAHTGDYFVEANNDPRSFQESYKVIDAYARYQLSDSSWNVTLWGKNLDNELYASHSLLSTFGGAGELYGPPRTCGVTFNYHWI